MSARPATRLRAAAVFFLAAALTVALAGGASAERKQSGNLIVALRGQIFPLELARRHPTPVQLRLASSLLTSDQTSLPRVKRLEIGLPTKGTISTRGLSVCTVRRLRNTTSEGALNICGAARVGDGVATADVALPGQPAFAARARLLVFNGPRRQGRRSLLLHAYSERPPTSVVVPFRLERRQGEFGLTMAADLPAALGPWLHLAGFQLTLGRRYSFQGRHHSFLSATCSIPRRFTAGFFSLAKVTYTLAGGRRIGTAITRSCRAA